MNFFVLVGVLMWCEAVIGSNEWKTVHFCGDIYALDKTVEELSTSQTQFSVNLYKGIATQKRDSNVAIGPIATYFGLWKIYFGAVGTTRSDMMKSINISRGCLEIQFGFQTLTRKIQNLNGRVLRVTNMIFYQRDLELGYSFRRIMESAFDSTPQAFNFSREDAHRKLRTTLMQHHPGIGHVSLDVKDSDSLVLVDIATYTEAWATTDNSTCLYDSYAFFYNDNYSMIEYVHKIGTFIYDTMEIAGVTAKFVGIPLENTVPKTYMFVILPDEQIEDFDVIQENIDAKLIKEMTMRNTKKVVHVTLPLLDIATSTDLTGKLYQKSGNGPYNETADLRKITKTRTVHVDRALHFTRVKLTKKCGLQLCPEEEMHHFNGDHPFIVVIATAETNPLVLIIGRYTGPGL